MFNHSVKQVDSEYAAVVDIGSGSVTVSIIYCNHTEERPMFIWSKREPLLLKQIKEYDTTAKHILTALTNSFLLLVDEGLAELRTYDSKAKIKSVQFSVAAPWSYTVTKRLQYKKDEPFLISESLIEQLVESAEDAVRHDISDHEISDSLGLTITTRIITDILANDYSIVPPYNQKANNLQVIVSSVVLQSYLQQTLMESQSTLMPGVKVYIQSFIVMMYFLLRTKHPEMKEFCIVNQTFEATEIAIVRDGVLTYSTHEPYGIASLCRDLAEEFGATVDEMVGVIQTNNFDTRLEKLPENRQKKVAEVLDRYHKLVDGLFTQTGDDFMVPKSIYVHSVIGTYDFLITHIAASLTKSTYSQPNVHNFDADFSLTKPSSQNTEMFAAELVSANFFHTFRHNKNFIQM